MAQLCVLSIMTCLPMTQQYRAQKAETQEENKACQPQKLPSSKDVPHPENSRMISIPLLQPRPTQHSAPFAGSPISCFSPSNFSVRQAAYVDSSCWDSLAHHKQDEAGQYKVKSLWPHKVKQTKALSGWLPGLGVGGRLSHHTPPTELQPCPPRSLPPHSVLARSFWQLTFIVQEFFKCLLVSGCQLSSDWEFCACG